MADSVNPLSVSRDAWQATGLEGGARVLDVEVICSDMREHRRRAEQRDIDIAGLARPTWESILGRHYEPWDRDHETIDTFATGLDEAVEQVLAAMR